MAKKKSGNKKKVTTEQTKPIQLTRKELRKEKRQQKKQAKVNYFEKKGKNRNVDVSECTTVKKKVTFNLSENKSKVVKKGNREKSNNSPEMKSHQKLLVKMKEQRKRQLLDANKEEDREIKFLEKRLKLGNKKDVSSSKGFADCGLDYILDACDPVKINSVLDTEVNFEDSDSDFYEDYKLVQKKNDIENDSTKLPKKNNANLTDNKQSKNEGVISKRKQSLEDTSEDEVHLSSEESDEDPSNCSDAEDSFNDSDEDLSDNELESNTEDDEKTTSTKGDTWEDIYGRLRDKKGNILEQNKGKYVPPHLRVTNDGEDRKKQIILKQLKSLLNKLIINNIHSISSQVEDLFAENSRHAMTDAMYTLYTDSIISPISSTKRSVIDHAMLIAVLHANVGSEIGACLIQKFIEKFLSLIPSSQEVENKETDNLILLISYLYNFKLFEARLMYDILKKLSEELTEKSVDLILVVLKSVGFLLRKDDPLAMKDFLLVVQKYMNKLPEVQDQSRMKYMLDILLNIKNNNLSKVSDYDPSEYEHLKKTLNSVIRSGNSIVPLAIGLEDILNVEEKGRWWLVGSAWNKGEEIQQPKKDVLKGKYSSQLLQLAKKQNMNTENRRNIFCILLSAEDYQDAFQKLVKLGLKGLQEREIPHVLIHCLLEEKNYNPYYAHVADQICMSDRRHQISLQCALWDKFKVLDKLKSSQINILAKFLSQLFLAGSLPISVLKVVEFAELDKSHIRLLRQTILTLVSEEAMDSMKQVFIRVSKAKKLSLFREALRLFIHHFILRNLPDEALKERIDIITSILSGEAS